MTKLKLLKARQYLFTALAFVAVAFLLGACAPLQEEQADTGFLEVWPKPPLRPKIGYKMSFSNSRDLGITRSTFEKLRSLVIGEVADAMIRPMAVVKTAGGLLYVADPGVKGVHRYDVIRNRHRIIQGAGEVPLQSPVGLALGSADQVYVADSYLAKVYEIKKKAKFAVPLKLGAKLVQPTGLAVDSTTGNIYVVDTAAHDIKVFGLDGKLINRFGGRGNQPGQFNYPTMVKLDKSGRLSVVDSLNFRVQTFDRDGNYLSAFGGNGDSYGDLPRAKGIATDTSGHIYITESMFHAFQIFDKSGEFLLAIGEQGHDPGQFWLPTGIHISDSNDIFICDSYNKRVQVFQYVGGGL